MPRGHPQKILAGPTQGTFVFRQRLRAQLACHRLLARDFLTQLQSLLPAPPLSYRVIVETSWWMQSQARLVCLQQCQISEKWNGLWQHQNQV